MGFFLAEILISRRSAATLAGAALMLSMVGFQPARASEAALFGMPEIRSGGIVAFTKWTGMLARLGSEAPVLPDDGFTANGRGPDGVDIDAIPAGNSLARLQAVNRMVNRVRYVSDAENWGEKDHWATPAEFYARNGDCEDFAIAKYVALKALGFDPSKMRIVILVDEKLQKHHAVLMVDTAQGRMILDNQIAEVVPDWEVKHYRPIYSINEEAWWLHVPPPRKRLVAQRNP